MAWIMFTHQLRRLASSRAGSHAWSSATTSAASYRLVQSEIRKQIFISHGKEKEKRNARNKTNPCNQPG